MNTQLIDSLARIILSLSEEERELLNRKIESEQRENLQINAQILDLETRIKQQENQYPMSSEEFYPRFRSGELGDDMDYFEWNVYYEMLLAASKELSLRSNQMEIADYICKVWIVTISYRYQWMDASKQKLRKRWDNVEHFPDLPNFPDHVHVGDELNVQPGESRNILQIITVIEREIEILCNAFQKETKSYNSPNFEQVAKTIRINT